ncbi:hypothetical protein QAD02_019548, partial [Eretmocerus hayati]
GRLPDHWNVVQDLAGLPIINYSRYAGSIFQGNTQCNQEVLIVKETPPTENDGMSGQGYPCMDVDAAGPSWATPSAPYNNGIPGDSNGQVLPSHVHDTTINHENSRRSLSGRMKAPRGSKLFSCTLCPAKLCSKNSLKRHMMLHTGNHPYSCKICEKGFTHSGTLEDHMRIHTGEKPFTCEICNKSFSQKGNLHTHVQKHTEEKPFPCSLCTRKFKFKSNCRRHFNKHMKKVPTLRRKSCARPILNKGCNLNSDTTNYMTVHGSSSCSTTNVGSLAHRQADDFQNGPQERHQYQQQPHGYNQNFGMVTT